MSYTRPWKVDADVWSQTNGDSYAIVGEKENEREDNALLIGAALDLLEACKAQHQAIDMLFAMLIQRDPDFFPSQSGAPWEAVLKGNAARAKAEGRS
jgi:hypothetical protein